MPNPRAALIASLFIFSTQASALDLGGLLDKEQLGNIGNDKVRIPLPENLQKVFSALRGQ